MVREESRIVTASNGPRPGGNANECFYCHESVGSQHKHDCVLFTKTVVITVQIELVKSVPASWTDEQVLFFCNESSSCSDNLIDDIASMQERLNKNGFCSCRLVKAVGVEDATEDDEEAQLFRCEE